MIGTVKNILSCDKAQDMINSIVTEGGKAVPRKRCYSVNLFADLQENRDGMVIYARLIPNTRRIFIRYLDIPLENHRGLINDAVKVAVDLNSEAYEVMFTHLNEWEKKLYAKAATVLQKEMEVAHHWGGLAKSDLASAYPGVYAPEYTIALFGRIHAVTHRDH